MEFLAAAMNLEHGSGDHPVAEHTERRRVDNHSGLHAGERGAFEEENFSCRLSPAGVPGGPRLEADLVGDLGQWSALAVARVTGFPYYGDMNVTLSLDDELVKTVRKIAVERDTSLTGMVREYLEKLAAEEAATGRRRRERETLERSFERFQFRVGKRTWKRADLHARS